MAIDEKKLIEKLKKVIESGVQDSDGIHPISAEGIIEYLKEQPKVGEWIPVTWHETTDDDGIDKEKYPICIDCHMPDDGQDILVCNKKSTWQDTCFSDDGYYLDSGNDWIDDVIAWQPLPEAYQQKGE